MRSIGLKLHDELLEEESGGLARRQRVRTAARQRAARLAEVSQRVRGESMRVNAEFAAIERDPTVWRAS